MKVIALLLAFYLFYQCAIYAQKSAAELRGNGQRFQFVYWDYLAFMVGISPAILFTISPPFTLLTPYVVPHLMIWLVPLTGMFCGHCSKLLEERDQTKRTKYFMLGVIEGAAIGYAIGISSGFLFILMFDAGRSIYYV